MFGRGIGVTASSCQARSNGAHIDDDTFFILQHLSQIIPRQLHRSHIVNLKDLLNLLSALLKKWLVIIQNSSCIAQDVYLGTPVKNRRQIQVQVPLHEVKITSQLGIRSLIHAINLVAFF